MQKKNCVLCISIGIIVCILLSACSRQPDFDAKSYVQSSLDAHYHGEYKDYANLLEISEKDAKKEIEEDFNESIQQQFDDSDNITDKGIADYAEKLTEVKKLAKYKVQDVKEEDGVYTVSVQVEPSNVFQTLQQSSTEVSNEKIKQGLDGNDPEVFAAVLTESVQKSLEKNRYGKAVTVNVSVEKDNSGKYGLLDTEMKKYGVEVTYLERFTPEEIERSLRPNTRVFYLESPSSNIFRVLPLAPTGTHSDLFGK